MESLSCSFLHVAQPCDSSDSTEPSTGAVGQVMGDLHAELLRTMSGAAPAASALPDGLHTIPPAHDDWEATSDAASEQQDAPHAGTLLDSRLSSGLEPHGGLPEGCSQSLLDLLAEPTEDAGSGVTDDAAVIVPTPDGAPVD